MKCSATTAGCAFVEAYANMGLSEFNLHDADRNVEGKLVRRNDGGVLCVQVTELKRAGGGWGGSWSAWRSITASPTPSTPACSSSHGPNAHG
ncbi:unnamed protein product, partial [Musa hybrid cultivar]